MTDEDAIEKAPPNETDQEKEARENRNALRQVQRGDAQAGLMALREKYHRRLVGYAGKTMRDYGYKGSKNADEIVNDVWSSFWEHREGKTIDNPPGYLRRMVRYQVLQALAEDIRARERHMKKEVPDMPDETERTKIPMEPEFDFISQFVEHSVKKEVLVLAISNLQLSGRLSQRKAEAVFLRYVWGFSAEVIAKRLHITVNNASSTISQGTKIVRAYLERRGQVD